MRQVIICNAALDEPRTTVIFHRCLRSPLPAAGEKLKCGRIVTAREKSAKTTRPRRVPVQFLADNGSGLDLHHVACKVDG